MSTRRSSSGKARSRDGMMIVPPIACGGGTPQHLATGLDADARTAGMARRNELSQDAYLGAEPGIAAGCSIPTRFPSVSLKARYRPMPGMSIGSPSS
jgi:hypothetical protein